VKYAFIRDHAKRWCIEMMCRVLETSVSGYRDFMHRPVAEKRTRLLTHIRAVHERSRGAYGWPRVWRELLAQGVAISKECTRLLMKTHGLRGRQKRKFVVTTQRAAQDPVAQNVLDRGFDVTELNTVWAGDITYIPTAEGWLFLAVVLDLSSRLIVGYAMADHMRTELAIEALTRACWRRKPGAGFIFHSDQGSQYTSAAYRQTLSNFGGVASMSRKGNCWDNAPSESSFGSLKTERVHGAKYQTIEDAKQDVLDWITWYNTERLHSSLGYKSPAAFEANLSQYHAAIAA
jgi:putative transposase